MTRRKKEARRAMERELASRELRAGPSRWARARARLTAQRDQSRSALRAAGAGALLAAACGLVVVPIVAGILTFSLVRDAIVLDDRGVRVAAEVIDYRTAGRRSDTVTVRPLEPPYFETDLDQRPGGLHIGQQLEVVFDPQNPGHAVAVGASPSISVVLGVGALDLFGLALLLLAFVPVGELVRRTWARARGQQGTSDRVTGDEPRTGNRLRRHRRTSPLAGLEQGQVVFLLAAAPVSVALSGLLAANVAGDAAVLQDSGVRARATVEKSSWSAGQWLDVRFSLPDGTVMRTDVTPHGRVYYEGDTLEVVYQADAPRNVQVVGDASWQVQAQIAVAVFVVCAVGSAVVVPVAAVDLVQRTRRARTALAPGDSPAAD